MVRININQIDLSRAARQGFRPESVRASDVCDAGPDFEPDASAEGQQESRAARSDARRYCGKVSMATVAVDRSF